MCGLSADCRHVLCGVVCFAWFGFPLVRDTALVQQVGCRIHPLTVGCRIHPLTVGCQMSLLHACLLTCSPRSIHLVQTGDSTGGGHYNLRTSLDWGHRFRRSARAGTEWSDWCQVSDRQQCVGRPSRWCSSNVLAFVPWRSVRRFFFLVIDLCTHMPVFWCRWSD